MRSAKRLEQVAVGFSSASKDGLARKLTHFAEKLRIVKAISTFVLILLCITIFAVAILTLFLGITRYGVAFYALVSTCFSILCIQVSVLAATEKS